MKTMGNKDEKRDKVANSSKDSQKTLQIPGKNNLAKGKVCWC